MPWGPARPHYWINGFLGGSAGDAFMFLRLYANTHERRWLGDARRLLAYVASRAQRQSGAESWPIFFDGTGHRPGGELRATGIEEGAAGIGWVFLQAWQLTHDPAYLATAQVAGDWLVTVAQRAGPGYTWPEDVGLPLTHTGLDNGAAGIGWFLHDLFLVTGSARFEAAARGAMSWLAAVMRQGRPGPYWQENYDGRSWHINAEPSWHWGTAGIAGFLARLDGLRVDSPGEEPGLTGGG
jgi:lantibiotic modifying enzyme